MRWLRPCRSQRALSGCQPTPATRMPDPRAGDDHNVALGSRRPVPKRAPAGHGVAQPDPGSARSQRAEYPWLIAGLRARSRLAADAGIYRDPGPGRSWARSSRICRRLDYRFGSLRDQDPQARTPDPVPWSAAAIGTRAARRAGPAVSPATAMSVPSSAVISHQAGGWLAPPPWFAAVNRP